MLTGHHDPCCFYFEIFGSPLKCCASNLNFNLLRLYFRAEHKHKSDIKLEHSHCSLGSVNLHGLFYIAYSPTLGTIAVKISILSLAQIGVQCHKACCSWKKAVPCTARVGKLKIENVPDGCFRRPPPYRLLLSTRHSAVLELCEPSCQMLKQIGRRGSIDIRASQLHGTSYCVRINGIGRYDDFRLVPTSNECYKDRKSVV